VYVSVSEIGEVENISKSYVSRIVRLALLAPDIVEAILVGRTDQALMLERLERPLPASWEEQRARLGREQYTEFRATAARRLLGLRLDVTAAPLHTAPAPDTLASALGLAEGRSFSDRRLV
jgi:hypothetical protein